MLDQRTKIYKDVKMLSAFVVGMLVTGLCLQATKAYASYEQKQREIEAEMNLLGNTDFLSPLPSIPLRPEVEQAEPHFYTIEEIEAMPAYVPVEEEPVTKSVEAEIREVFGEYAEQALKVARCESGLRPTALNDKNKNGTSDSGVFQINSVHGVRTKWLNNQSINIRIAYQLFVESGYQWTHWRASNHCHKLIK